MLATSESRLDASRAMVTAGVASAAGGGPERSAAAASSFADVLRSSAGESREKAASASGCVIALATAQVTKTSVAQCESSVEDVGTKRSAEDADACDVSKDTEPGKESAGCGSKEIAGNGSLEVVAGKAQSAATPVREVALPGAVMRTASVTRNTFAKTKQEAVTKADGSSSPQAVAAAVKDDAAVATPATVPACLPTKANEDSRADGDGSHAAKRIVQPIADAVKASGEVVSATAEGAGSAAPEVGSGPSSSVIAGDVWPAELNSLATSVPVVMGIHSTVAMPSVDLGVEAKHGAVTSHDVSVSAATNAGVEEVSWTSLQASKPNQLEVGIKSGELGWVKVRAELNPAGELHTFLRASSASSTESLQSQTPKIEAFLGMQNVAVHSVRVEASGASAGAWSEGVAADGGAASRGQSDSPDDGARERSNAVGREGEDDGEDGLPIPMVSGRSSVWMDGTGNWVSVRA